MSFRNKFILILVIALILPFCIILTLIRSGAEDCTQTILENLPSKMEGNETPMDEAIDKYCNPDTGKYQTAQKFADQVRDFFPTYLWIAIVGSLISAGIWEHYS